MRILLLGGTGAMGTHLSTLLSRQGNDVFVTTRKERMDNTSVIYLKGDAHDRSFIEEILREGWDAIVDFMVYHTDEFVGRVNLLLRHTDQYVYLSSARVFANEDTCMTERSPRLLDVSSDTDYLKTDEYALAKARQEDILRASGCKNWTIVRPYITFSEIRLQLGVYEKEHWLYRALRGRSIVFSKDIARHYTTLTYSEEVAQGIAGLIGNKKALVEDFNIMTAESLTWQEVLDIYVRVIEECAGKRPKVVYTDACLNLSFKRRQYQVRYCRLFDRRFDNSKILSVVPDLRFMDVRVSLRICLRTLINSRELKLIGWNDEALLDRVSAEFTPMREIGTTKRYMVYLLLRKLPFDCVKYMLNHR